MYYRSLLHLTIVAIYMFPTGCYNPQNIQKEKIFNENILRTSPYYSIIDKDYRRKKVSEKEFNGKGERIFSPLRCKALELRKTMRPIIK